MPGTSALGKRTPQNSTDSLAKLRRLSVLANSRPTPVGMRPVPVMASGAPTLTWTNTSTPSTVGIGQQWQYAAGKCTAFGGNATVSAPGYVFNSRFFSNANGGVPGQDYFAAEAIINDSVCGIFVNGAVSNGVRIQVDGQLVSATQTTPGASSYNVLKIDFAGVRQPRRITAEFWGGGVIFIGFLTSPTGFCHPTRPDPFKLMVLGDSVADGTGGTWNGDGFPRALAQHLGVSDLRVSANGGTGFISVTGTGIQNYQTRTIDVATNAPDLLVVALSSNDFNQTSGALATAVGTFLTTVRASFPRLPIVMFGVLWNDASLSTAQAQEAAVQTAVTGRGDPWLKFVNTKVVSSGSVGPVFGLGVTGATTGTGNSDWAWAGAGVNHPTTEGHLHIARFVAEEVKRCVAEWLAAA